MYIIKEILFHEKRNYEIEMQLIHLHFRRHAGVKEGDTFMKLSFGIPEDLDRLDRQALAHYAEALSGMGYAAVEPMINDAAAVDADMVREVLKQFSIGISGLRTGSIYGKNGWSFADPDPEVRRKAVGRLKQVITLAGELKTSVMVGLMQGHPAEGCSVETAEERIAPCLRECAEWAAGCGVTIMYESVNRFELEYHNTIRSMIDMIRRIDPEGKLPIRILADVYHMHLEDPSVPSALIRSMPYLGHIHFADSTRKAPGSGCIDFVEVIKDLEAMDYAGYATVEVTPVPSVLGSAEESIRYLQPILDRYKDIY